MIRKILKRIALEARLRKLDKAGCSTRGSHCNHGFRVVSNKLWPKRFQIGKNGVIDALVIFERTDTGRVSIGDRCHIGGNTKLISITEINIGNDVTIAWDCTIYDHDSHPLSWEHRKNDTIQEFADISCNHDPIHNKDWTNVKSKPILIKDKAWLGFGVTVLKGVTIGEGAIIGAQSVVARDIPDYCVAAGNPARIIRYLQDEARPST